MNYFQKLIVSIDDKLIHKTPTLGFYENQINFEDIPNNFDTGVNFLRLNVFNGMQT